MEDEFLLADDLARALTREGATVLGPVATEAGARRLLADAAVDCAVLDINLRGKMVFPLARDLRARRIPFLFVSGYDEAQPEAGPGTGSGTGADEAWDEVALLQKPVGPGEVIAAVGRLLN